MIDILQSRTKRLDRYSYKLHEEGQYGLDVAIAQNVMDVDEGSMSITFPFADGNRRDGVGDLIEIGGIRLERHRMNPVVLFDHGKHIQLPIGMAEDPKSREYTVKLLPEIQQATVKAFFYQGHTDKDHALFCEQLFDMMCKRFIRAGSIGYTLIDHKEIPPNYERGIPKGLHLKSVLMLEASAVVMPCNQDTVRKALCIGKSCGKPLSPMLVKSLSSYAPKKKAQLGYEGKAVAPIASGPRNLSTNNVPPAKWNPGVGATSKKKSTVKEIRQKYRKSKGMKRVMRKSSAGSSIVYVGSKDMDRVKELATQKGLKIKWMASADGTEKLKLTGDDSGIDEVAKQYGKPIRGIKSMDIDTLDAVDDTDVMAEESDMDEAPDEKLGAQVLRRLHEDHSTLMEDYHSFIDGLENEKVKDILTRKLETIESELTEWETTFEKLYKEDGYDPLDSSGTKGLGEDSEEEELDQDGNPVASEEDADGDGSIDGSPSDEAPSSADSAEEDLPTPDEAVEGMKEGEEKKEKSLKALRKMYRRKGLPAKRKCVECGKEGCKCKKDLTPQKEEIANTDVPNPKQEINPAGEVTNPEEVSHLFLKPHETEHVGGASQYLRELTQSRDYGDEHRMKAYHWHKSLEPMHEPYFQKSETPASSDGSSSHSGTFVGGGSGTASDGQYSFPDTSFDPRSYEKNMDGQDPTLVHRSGLRNAGKFLYKMAFTKDFGDPHRQESGMHADALDQILNLKEDLKDKEEEGSPKQEEETPKPGDMDMKSLEEEIDRQNKEIEAINKKLTSLRL